MHAVELFRRFLAVLLGFLGVGVPGEQRLFGVGPELVTASLDREGRPPEELRVLVGLADDDLDGAALTGRDRTGIAVAAFQELDQSAPQRVIEMTQVDPTRRLDVHRVARHDQFDRIPTGDLAAGVSLAVDVERGQRRLARSEEHTSELQSRFDLVCRLLLEKKKKMYI